MKAQHGHHRSTRASGDTGGEMRTTKGLEMNLCRLFNRRQKSMLRASKRLALAAAIASFASIGGAQSPTNYSSGGTTLPLAPVLSASAVDAATPANAESRQCRDKASCAVATNQPITLEQNSKSPARLKDRHGMPIPMIVIGENRAAATSMIATANGEIASGSGQVSLAVAQASNSGQAASPDGAGGSLIDINVPIPGVPQPVPPKMLEQQERISSSPVVLNGGIEASINDITVEQLPSEQISSRRVAPQEQRGPQLVRRGEPMKISIEASPAEQSLEAMDDEDGKIEVSFGDSPEITASQMSALPLPGNQSFANQPLKLQSASPEGEGAPRLPEASTPTNIATAAKARAGFRAEPTMAPLQLTDLEMAISQGPSASTDKPSTDQQFSQLNQIANSSLSEDEQPKKLDVDVDPSQMTIGDQLVISREKPVVFNMESSVLDYSVEHPGICRLIQTSDKSLSLIGLQEGDTRIAVVTAGGQEKSIEIRGVRVAGGERPLSRLQTFAREITQTIKRLHPYSDVQVVASSDELIVQGYVQLEKDARKILTLVRKTSLSPVVDRLHSMTR